MFACIYVRTFRQTLVIKALVRHCRPSFSVYQTSYT